MENTETKNILMSKTVWAAGGIIVYNVLRGSGYLPEDISQQMVADVVNSTLAIMAAVFRHMAKTQTSVKLPVKAGCKGAA